MHGDPIAAAQARVDATLASRPGARVLEAGCGARSHLTYPTRTRIVGVDLLRSQLERYEGSGVLAQGDVTALSVADASVDIVVCWDVLEHLLAPERAIAEIARVLRPDGLAVLALPNILSLKGLATRATPWWFHVWVYRTLLGNASVGTDESDQFPTAFRFSLRPAGLARMAAAFGLRVESLELYEGPVPRHLRRRFRLADIALGALGLASRIVTLGRYDTTLSDMVVVLTKSPGASPPRRSTA